LPVTLLTSSRNQKICRPISHKFGTSSQDGVAVDLAPGLDPDVMAASARLEQKLGSNLAKVLVSLTALLYVSDYCRGMTGG